MSAKIVVIEQGSEAWVALAEAFGADPWLPPDVYKISIRDDAPEGVSVKVNEGMWSSPRRVEVAR